MSVSLLLVLNTYLSSMDLKFGLFGALVLCMLFQMKAYCQKERYEEIADTSKRIYYHEPFDNNELMWSNGSDGKSSGEMKDGVYTWRSLYKGARITYNSFVFPADSNFEIEALMRFDSGDSTSLSGLVWGYENAKKCYVFGFNNVGSLMSYKSEDSLTVYKPWQKSAFYKKNDWNKLTIRRVDDYTTCYLNEQLVARIPFEPFFDEKIGFMVPPYSVISIDWLKICILRIKKSYE